MIWIQKSIICALIFALKTESILNSLIIMHLKIVIGSKFIAGLCTICQSILIGFPGKNPMMFYFCVGKMPKSLIEETVKRNWSFDFILLCTIVSHFFCGIKFWMFDQKDKREVKKQDYSVKSFIFNQLNKESLYR